MISSLYYNFRKVLSSFPKKNSVLDADKPKPRAQADEHGVLATVYGEINGNFSLLWSTFQILLRLQELCGFPQWCEVRLPYNRFRW